VVPPEGELKDVTVFVHGLLALGDLTQRGEGLVQLPVVCRVSCVSCVVCRVCRVSCVVCVVCRVCRVSCVVCRAMSSVFGPRGSAQPEESECDQRGGGQTQ
jgi:hypothetical protein